MAGRVPRGGGRWPPNNGRKRRNEDAEEAEDLEEAQIMPPQPRPAMKRGRGGPSTIVMNTLGNLSMERGALVPAFAGQPNVNPARPVNFTTNVMGVPFMGHQGTVKSTINSMHALGGLLGYDARMTSFVSMQHLIDMQGGNDEMRARLNTDAANNRRYNMEDQDAIRQPRPAVVGPPAVNRQQALPAVPVPEARNRQQPRPAVDVQPELTVVCGNCGTMGHELRHCVNRLSTTVLKHQWFRRDVTGCPIW